MSKERHDEDFLDAIRAADGPPSTPEIADALGCADRTALVRLHELADAGEVKRRKSRLGLTDRTRHYLIVSRYPRRVGIIVWFVVGPRPCCCCSARSFPT